MINIYNCFNDINLKGKLQSRRRIIACHASYQPAISTKPQAASGPGAFNMTTFALSPEDKGLAPACGTRVNLLITSMWELWIELSLPSSTAGKKKSPSHCFVCNTQPCLIILAPNNTYPSIKLLGKQHYCPQEGFGCEALFWEKPFTAFHECSLLTFHRLFYL